MDDLISRQAAMDICDTFNGQGSVWAVIKGYIKVLPPVEQKQEGMTVEEYRQRMMDAFHNADCSELIALVVLPTEKEFEHLEWLLEKHYKAKPEPKQGEWKEPKNPYDLDGTYYCFCSACGSDAHEQTTYCPNCGAKMEVDDENSN